MWCKALVRDYNLAGVNFRINADFDFVENEISDNFATQFSVPDITVNIKLGDIPEFDNPIVENEWYSIYQNEKNEKIRISFHLTKQNRCFFARYTDFGADCICNKDLSDGLRDIYRFWNMFGYDELLYRKNRICIHACMIEYNNEAILFCGNSGIGKSTQGELWKNYENAVIINGDRSILHIQNDIVVASSAPICGSSGICINKTLPVKAIVILGRSSENHIERLNGFNALCRLLENIPVGVKATEECIKICSAVPIYKLDCTPDETAVNTLKDVIY